MKIEADVLGVEQAVDFNTMETKAFVVLEVLGAIVRAPISEEQMEQLTVAAVRQRQLDAGETFDDTRDKSATADTQFTMPRFDDQPVRDFSVMSELTDHQDTSDSPPGMEGLFDSGEEAKIEQLRRRPPLALPRASAPAPQPPSDLPQLPGFGGPVADDDFQQG